MQLLPQCPGGEGLSRTAVSVHVVINASCPHARLPLALTLALGRSWLGVPLGGRAHDRSGHES